MTAIKTSLLDANTPHKSRDIGETNRINQSIFEGVYGSDTDAFDQIKQMFVDKYSYDISKNKSGPYMAYVLQVLSGPQANNAASTDSSLTNTAPRNDDDSSSTSRWKTSGEAPIRIIARIPEFDIDIDWPKDNKDQARIASHSEFHALGDSNKNGLAKARVGSTVWVSYHNPENTTGFDGRPAGHVIGLQDVGDFNEINDRAAIDDLFYPECKGERNLAGPSGGKYVGNTIPNPGSNPGPIAKKIKNKIKTGIYGNGTAQTKAHFDAALNSSTTSVKHEIKGPTPNSKNAFIWVGHLKHNGFLDILDRPISPGRETIIYAPMTLDLGSPVEIKYYFHEAGGFGHSWIHGPETTMAQATSVPNTGNDFKDKIGPGIKDLIRDGRNFILVIPEMAHSRGFGSEFNDSTRISKLIKGLPAEAGEKTKLITTRTVIGPASLPLIKNYLSMLPTKSLITIPGLVFDDENEMSRTILQETHLRQREKATFDGTFSGGNFKLFHEEVVQVLRNHLGISEDNIGFKSIVADGLGAVSLAAMVREMPGNVSHTTARADFRSMAINRIDFIDRASQNPPPDMDTKYAYGFLDAPSVTIYKDYLLFKSNSNEAVEFNYVTEHKNTVSHPLFSTAGVGGEQKFRSHNKTAPKPGAQRFSIFVNPTSPQKNTYVSFHITPKDTTAMPGAKVGYAFSMVNDFLESFSGYPSKGDSKTGHPTQDLVPDHANAAAVAVSSADTPNYMQEQEKSIAKIQFFEDIMNDFADGTAAFCDKYPAFCKKISGPMQSAPQPITSPSGVFFASYKQYLEHKKRSIELDFLMQYDMFLPEARGDRDALASMLDPIGSAVLPPLIATGAKKELDTLRKIIKREKYDESWENFNKHFSFSTLIKNLSPNPNLGGVSAAAIDIFINDIDIYASYIAEYEALQKLIKKIENAIEEAGPESVNKQEDCPPGGKRPQRMGRMRRRQPRPQPGTGASAEAAKSLCVGKNIRVVDNYEELIGMIPYFPKKTHFQYEDRYSNNPTNIRSRVEGFEVKTFKYRARSINNSETYRDSPPVWSCISDILSESWTLACNVSRYVPFRILGGMSGLPETKKAATAYESGLALSALGLSIDIDPQITGYSNDGDPLHSVFTGAWSPDIVIPHAGELYELGVFEDGWLGPGNTFLNNVYQGFGYEPRLAENYSGAEYAYDGPLSGEGPDEWDDEYEKIMNLAAGSPIVPAGSNPVLWVLTFCEKSGMKWGNGQFLKRRHRGGSFWNSAEQRRIAAIYGIPDIVARVNAISWKTSVVESHMRFQYWAGSPLINWSEIDEVREKLGK